MYDENLVAPMREEAVAAGCQELRTEEAVDEALAKEGTALVFINSVCGCAAAMARPGLALALQNAEKKPTNAYTCFAGNDSDATNKARSYFVGIPPSSPAMGLLKDGQLVAMLNRHDIEGHSAQEVAMQLIESFNEHC